MKNPIRSEFTPEACKIYCENDRSVLEITKAQALALASQIQVYYRGEDGTN